MAGVEPTESEFRAFLVLLKEFAGVPEGFTGKITFHCCNGTPCVAEIFTSEKIVKPRSR